MMLKLVDTSQKIIILGIFILDKVTRLRALLDPPPPQDCVSELIGRYPLTDYQWSDTMLQSKFTYIAFDCPSPSQLMVWKLKHPWL